MKNRSLQNSNGITYYVRDVLITNDNDRNFIFVLDVKCTTDNFDTEKFSPGVEGTWTTINVHDTFGIRNKKFDPQTLPQYGTGYMKWFGNSADTIKQSSDNGRNIRGGYWSKTTVDQKHEALKQLDARLS